jgi:nitrogenase cofactor biosynthesis protein NifB
MERQEKEPGNAAEVMNKTSSHPCFNGTCKTARMHIPVAPACNISCNYCNRKFDCINESRPGVTSEILTPEEAAEKFTAVRNKFDMLKVVGIAGPGDALANFENSKRSIERIHAIDPQITFCLSTNGLMLPHYADEIIKLGITHVTITINTIDPVIGAVIYKEINYMGRKITGAAGAEILLKNQLEGLKYLSSHGVVCKVNIVMIKGVNDRHIEAVVRKVKEYGAFMTNIMPLIPARGSAFEDMPLTNNKELSELRRKCEIDLKQMYHCRQCRADAIGLLGEDCSAEFRGSTKKEEPEADKISAGKSYTFAVATKTGKYVDQHFGQTSEFYIYNYKDMKVNFLEKRTVGKYCAGSEECEDEDAKIQNVLNAVKGCEVVLVLRIGYRPSKLLEDHKIKIVQTCDSIEKAIESSVKELALAAV